MNKITALIVFVLLNTGIAAHAQEWQWMVPVDSVVSKETNANPNAFLWIPPGCKQVRGVVIGQHNMIEEGIFEHPDFRKPLAEIGFAEIWITPGPDLVFNFNKGAGEPYVQLLKKLAAESGYTELEFVPIVPIGHSAAASYPWNFGAWAPSRTLAMLSVHGDAPLTNLTGSGIPNPDWGNRTIEGIPGLMVMGEYEWWENRLKTAIKYKQDHPSAPISLLADAGHGHFDYSDELVNYLALFIKKAAQYRLPANTPRNTYPVLNPINPQKGWLADRWHRDSLPQAAAAPYAQYKGNRAQAFWYFDKGIADATEKYYAVARGKRPQYIGFVQDNSLVNFNQKQHARIIGKFEPLADGLTFHISAAYTDTLRKEFSTDHDKQKINISRICGPVVKIDDTTFSVRFYRMGLNNPKRTGDIWLLAASNGDAVYKSSVQQFNMRIPLKNDAGEEQHIKFPAIADVTGKTKTIRLIAKADKGLQVYYYIQQGPAIIKDDSIVLTDIPPRSKYPVKVTVVAWQYGRSIEPKIRSAEPVSRTFYITAPL
jgi:hypothetical protein